MARRPGRSTLAVCPCGSGRNYSRCCAPMHRGAAAPTAEALMRSRYSAHVKGLAAHLLRTWDDSTRPETMELDPAVRWTGLEVLRTVGGGPDDTSGTVEFAAHHERDGVPATLHEVSHFVRAEGRWVYLDGVAGRT